MYYLCTIFMPISLTQLFGAGATQTATSITLQKADFADIGLDASETNSAQSLFAAIFLKAAQILTEDNQALDISQLILVLRDLDSLTTRSGNTYTRVGYSVSFDKLTPTIVVDPDDFT